MGAGMSFKFRQLLEERRLVRIKPDRKLVLKEIEGAKSDLETAKSLYMMEISNGLQFKATTQFFMPQEHCSTAKGSVRKATMLSWSLFRSFLVMNLSVF